MPAGEIRLPAKRVPVARTDPLALLGPSRPGESVSHAPGPVDDAEAVHVGLAPDGTVRSVVVEQTLTVNGVGDFELRVLAPVVEVDAPAAQSPQPGLRRTTVIWHGFSPGRKVLRSTLTLQADAEAVRLPLAVVSAGGVTTLRNQTALPVTVEVGPADVSLVVSAVRRALAQGQDPLDVVPQTLPAAGPVAQERLLVAVPLHVAGSVGDTPVDAVVGDVPLTLSASGEVRLRVTSALPHAASLASDAGVRDLQRVLHQAARKADVDVFVGATVPGPSSTEYLYAPAAAPPPAPPPPAAPRANPVAVALALAGAVALAVAGRAVWLRS